MKSFQRYYLIRMITTFLCGAGVGVFFLLAVPYAKEMFEILIIAMGLLTVWFNLPMLIRSLFRVRRPGVWVHLVLTLVSVALGVLLIFAQRKSLLIPLGVYSLCLPLVRVALVRERKKQLRREVPMLLCGAAMITIFLCDGEKLTLRILAVATFVLIGIYLLRGLICYRIRFPRKKKEKTDCTSVVRFEEK